MKVPFVIILICRGLALVMIIQKNHTQQKERNRLLVEETTVSLNLVIKIPIFH